MLNISPNNGVSWQRPGRKPRWWKHKHYSEINSAYEESREQSLNRLRTLISYHATDLFLIQRTSRSISIPSGSMLLFSSRRLNFLRWRWWWSWHNHKIRDWNIRGPRDLRLFFHPLTCFYILSFSNPRCLSRISPNGKGRHSSLTQTGHINETTFFDQ